MWILTIPPPEILSPPPPLPGTSRAGWGWALEKPWLVWADTADHSADTSHPDQTSRRWGWVVIYKCDRYVFIHWSMVQPLGQCVIFIDHLLLPYLKESLPALSKCPRVSPGNTRAGWTNLFAQVYQNNQMFDFSIDKELSRQEEYIYRFSHTLLLFNCRRMSEWSLWRSEWSKLKCQGLAKHPSCFPTIELHAPVSLSRWLTCDVGDGYDQGLENTKPVLDLSLSM